ncbi:cytidine deaminase-like protein [Parathielavia appendiculata]|uniref:Cytidine deaminase-like protein n=1 Tax=Parathielavia appendiculata TaxID=2587402 RepID=A0AAN6U9D7_9PEZI|nr:cytidine deaminase-like protein [Parathielavia appendiculata]
MAAIPPGDHQGYMRLALEQARKSPPKPTNYRVGAVLVDTTTNQILATGYTLELPGNAHAEQCCFMKLAEQHGVPEERLRDVLPSDLALALYTTVEPCSKRLSGNLPCVERVLRLANLIRSVYVGVMEPETFVAENTGRRSLENAGITVVRVEGLEKEILEVATAGHVKS